MKQTNKQLLQCAAILSTLYFVTVKIIELSTSIDSRPDDNFTNARWLMGLLLFPLLFKYTLQLLSLIVYPLIEKYRHSKTILADTPKVTVLIPAWNEEVGILKTLHSVCNSNYTNLEIIVINDGSTDKTHQLITGFIDEFKKMNKQDFLLEIAENQMSIKYIRLPNGGKARALNRGIGIATGEFILTLDADSVMDENMVANMIRRFTDESVAAVAGNVIVGNRKKPIEILQQLEYLQGFWFKRADSNFNSVHIIGGAAAAYRKSALDQIGGFDENIITEDVEISTRLLANGFSTRYAADAAVYTEGPSEWGDLCKQRLRWKYGRILTYLKHRNLFFSRSKEHKVYLTFLILPVAIYAEIVLLLEVVLLTIFYGFTFYTGDFIPLVVMIGFITTITTLQILFDSKAKFHCNLLLCAPVAWLMFYVIDVVEFQALCRSLNRVIQKKGLEWQTWVRVGIISQSVAERVNHSVAVTENEPI